MKKTKQTNRWLHRHRQETQILRSTHGHTCFSCYLEPTATFDVSWFPYCSKSWILTLFTCAVFVSSTGSSGGRGVTFDIHGVDLTWKQAAEDDASFFSTICQTLLSADLRFNSREFFKWPVDHKHQSLVLTDKDSALSQTRFNGKT